MLSVVLNVICGSFTLYGVNVSTATLGIAGATVSTMYPSSVFVVLSLYIFSAAITSLPLLLTTTVQFTYVAQLCVHIKLPGFAVDEGSIVTPVAFTPNGSYTDMVVSVIGTLSNLVGAVIVIIVDVGS